MTTTASEERRKKKTNRIPTTHGFRSLGFRRRLTSANLRVFLALPMVEKVKNQTSSDGGKELGRLRKCDDGCLAFSCGSEEI